MLGGLSEVVTSSTSRATRFEREDDPLKLTTIAPFNPRERYASSEGSGLVASCADERAQLAPPRLSCASVGLLGNISLAVKWARERAPPQLRTATLRCTAAIAVSCQTTPLAPLGGVW